MRKPRSRDCLVCEMANRLPLLICRLPVMLHTQLKIVLLCHVSCCFIIKEILYPAYTCYCLQKASIYYHQLVLIYRNHTDASAEWTRPWHRRLETRRIYHQEPSTPHRHPSDPITRLLSCKPISRPWPHCHRARRSGMSTTSTATLEWSPPECQHAEATRTSTMPRDVFERSACRRGETHFKKPGMPKRIVR